MRQRPLVYSRRYARRLEDIYEHIAAADPAAASRTIGRIRAAVERLASFPEIGRPGRVMGTRELVISGNSFIVPYRVRDGAMQVITILHSSQCWPAAFPE